MPALAGLAGGARTQPHRRRHLSALAAQGAGRDGGAAPGAIRAQRAAAETLFGAIDQHQEQAALGSLNAARPTSARAIPRRHGAAPRRRNRAAAVARGAARARRGRAARTKNGEAALHLAALHPEPIFADILLAAGADPRARNADGETPLHWAALSGHIVVAQRLIARGAGPEAQNCQGLTARDYARREGHAEIARLLERFDQ